MSAYMLYNTYTRNPTYRYDPIVNFQVRTAAKWLATEAFIKDTVVSQLFLLTYSTHLCASAAIEIFFLDDNILCYGKEFEICTTNEIHTALCVIFTILVAFSRDNALFASKAKINIF